MFHTHLSEFHMDVACRSRQCATCDMDHDWSRICDADGAVVDSKLLQDQFVSIRCVQFHEEQSYGASDVTADKWSDNHQASLRIKPSQHQQQLPKKFYTGKHMVMQHMTNNIASAVVPWAATYTPAMWVLPHGEWLVIYAGQDRQVLSLVSHAWVCTRRDRQTNRHHWDALRH